MPVKNSKIKKDPGPTLGQLSDPKVMLGLSILTGDDTITADVSFELCTIFDAVKAELDRYEEVRRRMLNKYCAKNEAGELLIDQDKQAYVLNDEAAFSKEFEKLTAIKVKIPTISLRSVATARISAANLKPLLGIIVIP